VATYISGGTLEVVSGGMLVGKHFDEPTIYRAAYAFEQAGARWKWYQDRQKRSLSVSANHCEAGWGPGVFAR
jgi:hypothetical protein